ncbi:formate hydrogenlyase subunit 3 [Cronobacter sakazakii E899]|nr:formate hydrogenlyase subunit 3 [Cronobacter sakazakii E899]
MNAIFLYQGALAAFGAGLVLALLCAWHKPLSALLGGLGGALGCLCALAAGGWLLLNVNDGPLTTHIGALDVHLTAFNAIWLATFGLPGFYLPVYAYSSARRSRARQRGAD